MPVGVFPPEPLMKIRIAEMKVEEGTTVQETPSLKKGGWFSRRWTCPTQAGNRPQGNLMAQRGVKIPYRVGGCTGGAFLRFEIVPDEVKDLVRRDVILDDRAIQIGFGTKPPATTTMRGPGRRDGHGRKSRARVEVG